ncbi:hypothetical protein MIZ01_1741 [Sideroxyarcus emersonii]|uniref:Uncharacterized protein n=1 Tax=Sideroxyarcus emersonii TaxID=2764705 RepID=A0AAN1XB65_9PROT|nr:hypothetical protein [Sideroxyarcus emersonii]BCK87944.1 hypothetical protein MIZ01_1741 [Sideroxyarcus emersonii]
MIQLDNVLPAWGRPEFEALLKQELARQAAQLPLQQGLSCSSSVADTPITAVILGMADLGGAIRVKAGIFYEGLIGGCSCAGDPTTDSEYTEYCEVQLDIDKSTAVAAVLLLAE